MALGTTTVFEMRRQWCPLIEPSTAAGTNVRLFSRVNPKMLREMVLAVERFVAEKTDMLLGREQFSITKLFAALKPGYGEIQRRPPATLFVGDASRKVEEGRSRLVESPTAVMGGTGERNSR